MLVYLRRKFSLKLQIQVEGEWPTLISVILWTRGIPLNQSYFCCFPDNTYLIALETVNFTVIDLVFFPESAAQHRNSSRSDPQKYFRFSGENISHFDKREVGTNLCFSHVVFLHLAMIYLFNNNIASDVPQYFVDLGIMSIFLMQEKEMLILGQLNCFNYTYLYNRVLLYRQS